MFISSKLSNNDSPAVRESSKDVHRALILQYKPPYWRYYLFLKISLLILIPVTTESLVQIKIGAKYYLY